MPVSKRTKELTYKRCFRCKKLVPPCDFSKKSWCKICELVYYKERYRPFIGYEVTYAEWDESGPRVRGPQG